MELEKDEKIIKKHYEFCNASRNLGFVINDKLYSGIKINLTNKRFYVEPVFKLLNKIIPLLPDVILDLRLKDVNNYSVEYVWNILGKIPRVTINYKDNQKFSFCTSKKDLKEWESKFLELSIPKK